MRGILITERIIIFPQRVYEGNIKATFNWTIQYAVLMIMMLAVKLNKSGTNMAQYRIDASSVIVQTTRKVSVAKYIRGINNSEKIPNTF